MTKYRTNQRRNTRSRIVVAAARLIVAINLVEIATWSRPAGTIGLLLVMFAWHFLDSIRLFRLNRRQTAASASPKIRRATRLQVACGFVEELFVILVLVGSYHYVGREQTGWMAGDLGIQSPLISTVALFIGAAASPSYLQIVAALHRRSRWPQVASRHADLAVLGSYLPRGRFWQGLKLFRLVLLGPVLEEIVFRGFFVYQLGILIGSVAVAVAIGLALCLCLHVYQGTHLLGRHVAFYVIVVALLYSPLGLTAAIGFHIGCNYCYAMNLAALVRYYRSCRHDRGRTKAAQVEKLVA